MQTVLELLADLAARGVTEEEYIRGRGGGDSRQSSRGETKWPNCDKTGGQAAGSETLDSEPFVLVSLNPLLCFGATCHGNRGRSTTA